MGAPGGAPSGVDCIRRRIKSNTRSEATGNMELRFNKAKCINVINAYSERYLRSDIPCEDGDCTMCSEEWRFHSNPPHTLFQAQLTRMDACTQGRIHVGAKSAREFWETTTRADYMRWLLGEIGKRAFVTADAYRDEFYGCYDGEGEENDAEACARIRAAFPFSVLREMSGKVRR